ncbi:hypothetical protein J1N35_014472 [Gossypium stocksii]|uniref:Reverse transcriptase zinc-binding domain-containing protein n=1 Tax=Gossypium stocksii TaxID=47602 RepID=A0A9D4A9T5_9ROSI|nr:hypothetical protein J1N35_014472 [Gossypium stocksii]
MQVYDLLVGYYTKHLAKQFGERVSCSDGLPSPVSAPLLLTFTLPFVQEINHNLDLVQDDDSSINERSTIMADFAQAPVYKDGSSLIQFLCGLDVSTVGTQGGLSLGWKLRRDRFPISWVQDAPHSVSDRCPLVTISVRCLGFFLGLLQACFVSKLNGFLSILVRMRFDTAGQEVLGGCRGIPWCSWASLCELKCEGEMFSDDEAARILSIPLYCFAGDDMVVWKGEPTNLFTRLWKACVSPKVHITVWRFLNDYVPTLYNLYNRHISHTQFYPKCLTVPETIAHVVWDCPFAALVWDRLHISWLVSYNDFD